MQTIWFILTASFILIISIVLIGLSLRWFFGSDDLSGRLNDIVTEQLESPSRLKRARIIQPREFTDSLANRVVLPWFRWIARVFNRLTPSGTIDELERKLVVAGNPLGLRGREFYGVKLAFFLVGIWLAAIFIIRGINRENVIMAVLSVIVCYLFPIIWLRNRVRKRQNIIRKGLPDAFDMLTVCASAGLGFDQSLQRVSEYWETQVGVEFGRVIAEMEMGLSREEALRNLSYRLDLTEMSSFVSFVLQTEQLGLSIADTLHTQADQMRVERRLRAQEEAQKIPTKMLFPMVFLIFPALLAIIMGPVIPVFIQFFNNIAGGTMK